MFSALTIFSPRPGCLSSPGFRQTFLYLSPGPCDVSATEAEVSVRHWRKPYLSLKTKAASPPVLSSAVPFAPVSSTQRKMFLTLSSVFICSLPHFKSSHHFLSDRTQSLAFTFSLELSKFKSEATLGWQVFIIVTYKCHIKKRKHRYQQAFICSWSRIIIHLLCIFSSWYCR